MKPSVVSRRRSSHLVIFGDPKTGKSTLVAELILKGYKLTWVSMDNGHEVLFKLPVTPAQLDEQLNLIILPDTKEFPIASETCRLIMSGKPCEICDRHGKIGCSECRKAERSFTRIDTNSFTGKDILVFDHLGQLSNSIMSKLMTSSPPKDSEYKPERDHYMAQGFAMDGFLTNVQQAPFNIICISHPIETEMEDGSKKLVPLIGTVNFSRNAGKYFDHIVYCEMKNSSHRFGSKTTYANKVVTGSRTDVAIEDLGKGERHSLHKFFDGSISAPPEAGGFAAEKVLDMLLQPERKKEKVEDALGSSNNTDATGSIASNISSDVDSSLSNSGGNERVQNTVDAAPKQTETKIEVNKNELLARLARMNKK